METKEYKDAIEERIVEKLRDIFAGVAMQGMASTYDCKATYSEGAAKVMAESAYTLADAMLKARKAKP